MSSEFEQCKESIRNALRNDSHIRYVIDSLRKISDTKVGEHTFVCTSESGLSSSNTAASILTQEDTTLPLAGYLWKDCAIGKKGQIFVNYDFLANTKNKKSHLESAMLHELIHAYDDARAFVDSTNCLHHACSEIRAARLSGECSWSNEWRNGNLNHLESGIQCVIRNAQNSVSRNPHCRGPLAEWAVTSTMPRCYKDYDPFVAPPYSKAHVYTGNVNEE